METDTTLLPLPLNTHIDRLEDGRVLTRMLTIEPSLELYKAEIQLLAPDDPDGTQTMPTDATLSALTSAFRPQPIIDRGTLAPSRHAIQAKWAREQQEQARRARLFARR
jgi:hypothetical protein